MTCSDSDMIAARRVHLSMGTLVVLGAMMVSACATVAPRHVDVPSGGCCACDVPISGFAEFEEGLKGLIDCRRAFWRQSHTYLASDDANMPRAFVALRLALFGGGSPEEAVLLLEEAVDSCPEAYEGLMMSELSRHLYLSGNSERAAQVIRAALDSSVRRAAGSELDYLYLLGLRHIHRAASLLSGMPVEGGGDPVLLLADELKLAEFYPPEKLARDLRVAREDEFYERDPYWIRGLDTSDSGPRQSGRDQEGK